MLECAVGYLAETCFHFLHRAVAEVRDPEEIRKEMERLEFIKNKRCGPHI